MQIASLGQRPSRRKEIRQALQLLSHLRIASRCFLMPNLVQDRIEWHAPQNNSHQGLYLPQFWLQLTRLDRQNQTRSRRHRRLQQ
jgi:hypothetical protein